MATYKFSVEIEAENQAEAKEVFSNVFSYDFDNGCRYEGAITDQEEHAELRRIG